jgi:Inositol monophosphatase family
MSLIYAMALGADSVDDCDVLRAGRTRRLLGGWVAAPSTLGTFLRAFMFGHVRQLDRLLAEALTRAWRAGAGPGAGRLTVDVDRRRPAAPTRARRAPLGAAALDLARAAAGRFDAYYERGVKLWDVAAGALICARAGLMVYELPSAPPADSGLLVAPRALAGELLALVSN